MFLLAGQLGNWQLTFQTAAYLNVFIYLEYNIALYEKGGRAPLTHELPSGILMGNLATQPASESRQVQDSSCGYGWLVPPSFLGQEP